MKTLPASQFKAQCLSLLDSVDPEGLIITKRGRPVARLLPIDRTGKLLIGSLKGQISVRGNILSTGIEWAADAES